MMKIVLIIPFFGKFRPDFKYWLKSVEYNSTIDFLLITDQNVEVPNNVRIIKSTFRSFVDRVQQFYQFPIALNTPYKICDYKPALGEIFQSEIKCYDFWGHCDTDLIFGDIRRFITDEVLSKYDRILTHGHLTLYRNTQGTNVMYKKALPSYKEVFSSNDSYAFDEAGRGNGTTLYWYRNLKDKLFVNREIYDDIFTLKDNFVPTNNSIKDRKNFIYSFNNGKLFRFYNINGNVKKEEILYVHFQKRKLFVPLIVKNEFTIIPNKIITYIESPTLDFLRKNAKDRIFNKQFFKIKTKTAKSRIKKCLFKFLKGSSFVLFYNFALIELHHYIYNSFI